ncbi:hypothetical protein D3C75_915350 [compost metagenome]
MHEDHVDIGVGVVEPARHGHHRRDTDTAGEVQHLARREVDGVEQPHRAMHRHFKALVHGVVQVVGHMPAWHPLDRDREAVGHRRRTGDGIGTHHRLAFDLQLQGHELPGLEEEHDRLVGHEAEGAHIPGFLDHLDATDDVAAVGPGLGADRIEEIGHARLHGRLRPDACDSAQAARRTHSYPRHRRAYRDQPPATRAGASETDLIMSSMDMDRGGFERTLHRK